MAKYRVTFNTTIHLTVTAHVPDSLDPYDAEATAGDQAWTVAQEYLDTVMGDHRRVLAEASLDGVGHDQLTLVAADTQKEASDA